MKMNFMYFMKLVEINKILPNLDNENFRNKGKRNIASEKKKYEYNFKLISDINNKKFDENDFTNLSNAHSATVEQIQLKSIEDNEKFDINSVKLMYALPINSFTLISDEEQNIYLAKVIKLNHKNIEKNSNEYIDYNNQTNKKMKDNMYASYDFLLNKKYKVKINQKTLERVKNYLQIMINRNFKDFKFRHQRNQNQVLFISEKIKTNEEILNLIDNFLTEKNSFIFESVEKGIIKGRYTIFGKNPDKIWEFNNNQLLFVNS